MSARGAGGVPAQIGRPHVEVRHLTIAYPGPSGPLRAVRDVSLQIRRGEILGIVGESGSGKSTLGGAIVADPPGGGRIIEGEVLLRGRADEPPVDLCALPARARRGYWGRRLAIVFQDPSGSLNPAFRIGDQIEEAVRRRPELATAGVRARTLELLQQVHMPDPRRIVRRYPHQLSGGQQQRALIAMALAADPDVLVLDEPTTGLDVTTEAQVLDLIAELRTRVNAAIVFITHNLAVIAQIADRVAVMYAGEIVELAEVRDLFRHPSAPYAAGLLSCIPSLDGPGDGRERLRTVAGLVPRLDAIPSGCAFAPRCPFVRDRCRAERPTLVPLAEPGHRARCFFTAEVRASGWPAPAPTAVAPAAPAGLGPPLLAAHRLWKRYGRDRRRFGLAGPRTGRAVRALNGVSFALRAGQTLGVVGESGCGKTTLANLVLGLIQPTDGRVLLEDRELPARLRHRPREQLRRIQMIFQSTEASLNPQHRVDRILARAARTSPDGRTPAARVAELLATVGLDPTHASRRPAELSGGEKQRVAIARALAPRPDVIVADEPTSALDLSVRASILNLLNDLQTADGVAFLFISHDLSAIRQIAHRVLVLYLGMVMEEGATEHIFRPPYHPYIEALLSAVPVPDPDVRTVPIRLVGAVPSVDRLPSGCPFHTRCPRKLGPICEEQTPPWRDAGADHRIFCHIPLDELRAAQMRGATASATESDLPRS